MHGWEDIMDSYMIAVSQENCKVTFFFLCKTYSWNNNVRQRTDNSNFFCTSLLLSFKSILKNIRIFPRNVGSPWKMSVTSLCKVENCFSTLSVGLRRLMSQNPALHTSSAHHHCCNIARHCDEQSWIYLKYKQLLICF